MSAIDLQELFQSLLMPMPAATGSDLSALPIPGSTTHRLAKDANGLPCLLIRQPEQERRPSPIRLENLQVSFAVPCNVVTPNGQQERDTFTIVRCTSTPDLFPHFLRIVSPLVAGLGPTPTPAAIRRTVAGLVELFQALTAPTRKTIQGLWAELLLLRVSSDPHALAAAWHALPHERFDFASGPQRLEVKSNSSRRREHHFTLEQVTQPGKTTVVIASVFVERSGGGLSLGQLFENSRARVSNDPALLRRIDAVFYSSLGSGWADAMDEAFDWELATGSLAFYAAAAVPKPDNPAPRLVSDVRFRSDLGALAPIPRSQLRELGNIYAACAP